MPDIAVSARTSPNLCSTLLPLKLVVVISAAHLRFCSERGRLLDLLTAAASDYAVLAGQLANDISALSPAAYRQKQFDVEHARSDAQQARDALEAHRKEHGC
jgi:hypothetical protein